MQWWFCLLDLCNSIADRRFKRRRVEGPLPGGALPGGLGGGGYSSGGYSSGAALAAGYQSPAIGFGAFSGGGESDAHSRFETKPVIRGGVWVLVNGASLWRLQRA